MDRLWAPWRASYIRDASEAGTTDPGCFLCRGLASREDRANSLVWRRPHSVVFLNRYPYNNGHLLVAPGSRSPWPARSALGWLATSERFSGYVADRNPGCIRAGGGWPGGPGRTHRRREPARESLRHVRRDVDRGHRGRRGRPVDPAE